MKSPSCYLKLFTLLVLVFGSFLFLSSGAQAEEITDFSVDIEVKQNSLVEVEEVIAYDFGDAERHGIYRDIPVAYTTKLGNQLNIDLKILNISDFNGKAYQYSTSRQGNNLQIKIGDPDKTISGKHVYKIVYTVSSVINFFDQHDELYWNVTGNDWPVPINYVQARVNLPSAVNPQDVETACFVGNFGSTDSSCIIQKQDNNFIFLDQSLSSKQGLTIVLGWPKGIVAEPTVLQKILKHIKNNILTLLPILIFISMFIFWYKLGRDKRGRGTIVPRYEPPRKLTPGEVGTIVDENISKRDIICTIIDLARQGYYKIVEIEDKKSGIFRNKDWKFVKLKDGQKLLQKNQHEWEIYNGLFGNKKEEVKLSELTDFHLAVKNYKRSLYQKITAKKFFPVNPSTTRWTYFGISLAVVLCISGFLVLLTKKVGLTSIISLAGSVAIIGMFSRIMPKKTRLGKIVQEEIKGFQIFLSVTEKDRLKFHFSPKSNPEKFVEYVPYAIALGVEKEWAQAFKNITIEQPSWYQSQDGGLVDSMAFMAYLNNFSATSQNSFTPKGSVVASGSSGFSGGGFGGGGGGSW